MKTKIYDTASVFDLLSVEWNTLLQSSQADTPFLTREWQAAYRRVFDEGVLKVIEVRDDDGTLIGIAPLYCTVIDGMRTLLFLGGADPSDYLDMIIARGREAEVGAAIVEALAASNDWDQIDLYNVPETSPTREWLGESVSAQGWAFDDERQVVSPRLILPESITFEDYVAGLKKRDRHELRRKLRRANATEGLRWYLVDGEFASELEPEVDAFIDLLKRSRRDKAEFMTSQMRRFFFEGVRAAHRGGWLQLAFLEVEGRKAATYLSFDYDDRLMVYNSGMDPDSFRSLSTGIVLMARLIENAIQKGKRVVDFMRGDEEYKYRLGAEDMWVHHLRVKRKPVSVRILH